MNSKDLKEITLARTKSARYLIRNRDWHGAAQMMGLALECALKASICRTLRISTYPEVHKDKLVPNFFMTHAFDRLLLVSGLWDIFSTTSSNPAAFQNWSDFTIQYQGDWITMRYSPPSKSAFDKIMTENLYKYLYGDKNSIIKVISKKRRW
jgi:hypothetical protein